MEDAAKQPQKGEEHLRWGGVGRRRGWTQRDGAF